MVAPAGCVNPDDLNQGVLHLTRMGYQVRLGKGVEKTHRYFAGTDAERADDFQTMWMAPDIDALVCARGGSGCARMLVHVEMEHLAQNPKICVGSSDITTLLLAISSRGIVSFHGPMVATHFGKKATPEMDQGFRDLLSGAVGEMRFSDVRVLRAAPHIGRVEGILMGGCLTLICTSIGTPYEIRTEDRILFLEDINEAPYRIDRMLSYLKGLGKFDAVRGVVFGAMPGCEPDRLPETILDVLGDFSFPILFGLPSGHGAGTATLPLGARAQVDTVTGVLTLMEPAVQ